MRERAHELFAETAIGRTRPDDGAKRLCGRRHRSIDSESDPA
jgi:hypothetical protein